MEKVLLLAHVESDGSLGRTTLEALSKAISLSADLGAEFTVGLVGSELDAAASQIGGCGAASYLGVSGMEFSVPRFASDRAAAQALINASEATVVLAPSTSRWNRCLGAACLRSGGRIDSHVSAVFVENEVLMVKRWFYRQRMEGELSRTQRPWCLLLEGGIEEPFSGAQASVQVTEVDAQFDGGSAKTALKGYEEPGSGEQTIRPDADLLFVAGAGWTKKQADGGIHGGKATELIQTFLKNTSASLGSSKSLVDMDAEGQGVLPFLSHLNQVGQTGSSPRHPKGLATCCHGEEPHVVGWRFVNERRAVNLDANCGWAQGKADVVYVADAFQVLEKLNELLS